MSSEGYACVTYPNGDVYDGGFVGGLRNGQGSYLFAGLTLTNFNHKFNISTYKRSERNGQGFYLFAGLLPNAFIREGLIWT